LGLKFGGPRDRASCKENDPTTLGLGSTGHHLPAVILGFFGGKKKFDPEKSYETFYRENVPEKPLQTHHDKLDRDPRKE
jgi:hypothetical protein